MNQEAIEDYARALILGHAQEIEMLTIFEVAEEDEFNISEEDAEAVLDAIRLARVTVEFP